VGSTMAFEVLSEEGAHAEWLWVGGNLTGSVPIAGRGWLGCWA
jgi:hypothetical protein